MKALIQRVDFADVKVDNKSVASIKLGLLIFIGIYSDDTIDDIDKIYNKIINLRIFDYGDKKNNWSILDIKGDILLVSQFTLCASIKKGNRPSFINAMEPVNAKIFFNLLFDKLSKNNIKVFKGKFGEDMIVNINNVGPMTIQIDTKE